MEKDIILISFDLKTMLSNDDKLYYYPVNHSYCGVMMVDGEGERYASTVTKTGHQEELNHLILMTTGKDVLEEKMGLIQEIIDLSLAVFLFKEGEVISFIPDEINKLQYRELFNVIDEIDFTEYEERHAFNEIYEQILKDLQSAGNAGEFYTPRAVTDFMVKMVNPQLGEQIADFACGTGGFLTSALKHLAPQIKTVADKETYCSCVYGIEKKALPYLLCATNLLLHDIDQPKVIHGNSLEKNVRDYTEDDKFNVILMNPPYGGNEKDIVKQNFPTALRSSETADLFMSVIMYRLKKDGRVAIVLPDGFLFGTDNAKTAIKEKLLNEFNLHTIVRLPHSVFAPYTSITTNLLFFDKTKPTEKVWFYRMDMPEGYKNFSKTKPIKLEHFAPVIEWWNNRQPITEDGFDKAKCFTVNEIKEKNYNLDLCGYPHVEEEILEPDKLIAEYQEKRASLNANIDSILSQITAILESK